jgi:hypothetical protein
MLTALVFGVSAWFPDNTYNRFEDGHHAPCYSVLSIRPAGQMQIYVQDDGYDWGYCNALLPANDVLNIHFGQLTAASTKCSLRMAQLLVPDTVSLCICEMLRSCGGAVVAKLLAASSGSLQLLRCNYCGLHLLLHWPLHAATSCP